MFCLLVADGKDHDLKDDGEENGCKEEYLVLVGVKLDFSLLGNISVGH